MRQLLLILITLTYTNIIASQEFAPIGAKWYYTELYAFSGDIGFITAEVIKDTIIHDKGCRMINNGILCGAFEQSPNFIYQEDSTIYFYVLDFDTFQILYDFGAKQGDTWNISFNAMFEIVTLQATVDTTFLVNINGHSLIRQWIKYTKPDPGPHDFGYGGEVTEIIGDSYYLFNLYSLNIVCDGNFSDGLRCYEDAEFGFYSTGIADSCTYRYDWVGIEDNMSNRFNLKIYPNPTAGQCQIEIDSKDIVTLEIINLLGDIIYSKEFVSKTQVDLNGYPNALYFACLKYNNVVIEMSKILKY